MKIRFTSIKYLLVASEFLALGGIVAAQTPAPVPRTNVLAPTASTATTPQTESETNRPTRTPRRATTPPARVTVIADPSVAPQVVTIVHRLSGVKMLRFLLRQNGDQGTLYT